ncbi:MAG: hypothetical protein JXA82_19485 [Sedimentisphaerales bacterium]|nr:hypothetical protein [Sedimentisphaerales bacterium]
MRIMYFASALLAVGLMGCGQATIYNARIGYDGPAQPLDNLAVIAFHHVDTKIHTVDGQSVWKMPLLLQSQDVPPGQLLFGSAAVLLTPGSHTFTFIHMRWETDWKGDLIRYNSYRPVEAQFEVQAGRLYTIKQKLHNYNTFRSYNDWVTWVPELVELGFVEQLLEPSLAEPWLASVDLWRKKAME